MLSKTLRLICLLACVTGYCSSTLERERLTYYVSPSGLDLNPGGPELPFASLSQARRKIRSMVLTGTLPPGGVKIVIRAGRYPIREGFVLGALESGTEEAPIEWVAETGATLVGGIDLPLAAFTHVSDEATLARLGQLARTHIRKLDLASYENCTIKQWPDTAEGLPQHGELFCNGSPLPLAGWPNQGWATFKEISGKNSDEASFEYDPMFVPALRWKTETGIWIHGFMHYDWFDETMKLKSIDQLKNTLTVMTKGSSYGVGMPSKRDQTPRRYRVVNCLEELDMPGEWFADHTSNTLYLWPPPNAESVVFTTLEQPVITIENASYITIKNLTIDCTLGDGILVNGNHNQILDCKVANTGAIGIRVNGTDNRIAHCIVTSTGGTCCHVTGGDLKTLTPGENIVEDCLISLSGRRRFAYAPGISLHGVGNIVRHNELVDHPHAALVYTGNEHVIERNLVRNACVLTSDTGAFHTARNWGSQGNIVRFNRFEDIKGFNDQARGIYLDDCDSGDMISHNTFVRVNQAVDIGGGRDNRVEGNLFIDCVPAVRLDDRGTRMIAMNAGPDNTWDLEAKLKAVNYKQPPWSERYPKLATIMDNKPQQPLGNELIGNVVIGGAGFEMKESLRQSVTTEDNQFFDGQDGVEVDKAILENVGTTSFGRRSR